MDEMIHEDIYYLYTRILKHKVVFKRQNESIVAMYPELPELTFRFFVVGSPYDFLHKYLQEKNNG